MYECAQIILKPPDVSTQIRRKSYRKRTQIVVVHSGPLMFPSRSKTSQESTKQRPKSSQKRVPETANGCLDPLRRDRRNTSEKRIDFVTVLTPTWRPRGTRNRQNVQKRAPETGPGKDAETAAKRRACNPQKQWFGIGGVAKITKPTGLQKVTKITPKRLPKWSQIEQKALPEASGKTHRK